MQRAGLPPEGSGSDVVGAGADGSRKVAASGERESLRSEPRRGKIALVIFDVDGVLLASPHERAWRDALVGFADPRRFTTAFYQEHVAGKPRSSGARAALEALGIVDLDGLTPVYVRLKQARLDELIRANDFHAFPDAIRMVRALRGMKLPMAAASSSKNANDMMRLVPLGDGESLFDDFAANVCGRDVPRGKPDPALFLLAASEAGVDPNACLVVEDAPVGIEAARAGGMGALGVARQGDATSLAAAGADMVVGTLDDVMLADLVEGRFDRQVA